MGVTLPAVLLFAAGCAPALDWREAKLADAGGLQAAFPCRPDQQARSLVLAGQPVTLTLYVCKAAASTFAVSHADVHNPIQVPAALRALREAAQANLSAARGQPVPGWQVAGETPQPEAGRWRLQGHALDGSELIAEVALFSRGTQVVQATVLGPAAAQAAAQPFFDGLRFVN